MFKINNINKLLTFISFFFHLLKNFRVYLCLTLPGNC